MNNLIVGAGLSGSVLANLISNKLNEKVLVIDRRSVIGGNIFDFKDKSANITVQKYGPHTFHTNNDSVWNYLSQFTQWKDFSYNPKAYIEGKMVNIPFSLNTLHQLFDSVKASEIENKLISEYGYGSKVPILKLMENNNLKFISEYIYENMFRNYSSKQWGIPVEEVDSSVIGRVPVYISNEISYFTDKYQGIPLNGYTKLIENLLSHKNIEVSLNTDFKDFDHKNFDRIFYSGSIDEYFNYEFGQLPYRSLEFDNKTLDKEYFQDTVTTYYPNDYEYTRITEHKYFLDEKSEKTIITTEYPKAFEEGKNERFYPVINKKNTDLYEKYLSKAKETKNLYLIGRLGLYKYLNMDTAVEKIFELFYKELYKQ